MAVMVLQTLFYIILCNLSLLFLEKILQPLPSEMAGMIPVRRKETVNVRGSSQVISLGQNTSGRIPHKVFHWCGLKYEGLIFR